jgi:hypothetical protein
MTVLVSKIDQCSTVGTEIRPNDTPEQYLQELARTLDEMCRLVGVRR